MTEPPGRRRRERVEVRRVQRPVSDFPIVHLEAEIPSPRHWIVFVSGLVEVSIGFTLEEIREMPTEERVWDLHCVWGWTRPDSRWEGVPASRLIDAARPRAGAAHAVAHAVEGPYASCLTLEEARAALIAWRLDGEDLTPEHGGPLRLVLPPTKWAYKGVKWFGGFRVIEHFTAGYWEELVGNPHGNVPSEMLDLRFE